MSTLIIAEHDGAALKPSTLNAIAAALKIGAPVHVLVAGSGCAAAGQAAAAVAGVSRVLLADAPHYGAQLAENLAALVVQQVRATPRARTSWRRPRRMARTSCRASQPCWTVRRSPMSPPSNPRTPSVVRSTPAMPSPACSLAIASRS